MRKFAELIAMLMRRLAEWMGLTTGQARRLGLLRDQCKRGVADNQDRLEALKEEIRQIERRIRSLKAEYERSHGPVKAMVGRQIEAAFREIDWKRDREAIIQRNIETYRKALEHVAKLEHARAGNLSDETLDDLGLSLEETYNEIRQADQALKEVDAVTYAPPEPDSVALEEKLQASETQQAETPGLSPQTAERLRKLETEGDY
ncbi:MAG: hypothetical protein D6766_07735 [Verrucomicrobia bacterium]|nr:MAG: hypothetical protein D6766_07735 [Verrucomicrobiota bacterium]